MLLKVEEQCLQKKSAVLLVKQECWIRSVFLNKKENWIEKCSASEHEKELGREVQCLYIKKKGVELLDKQDY